MKRRARQPPHALARVEKFRFRGAITKINIYPTSSSFHSLLAFDLLRLGLEIALFTKSKPTKNHTMWRRNHLSPVATMVWLLLLVTMTACVTSKTTDDTTTTTASSSFSSTCGLYLAVSSTSTVDEPKWGMYAGIDYTPSQMVGVPEVAIQTLHLAGAVNQHHANDASTLAMVDYLERFFWVPVSSGGQYELPTGTGSKIITAIPGAGAIGAYNKKLTNAEWNHSAAYLRPAWGELPQVSHPNRGAQSHYYHVQLRAKQDISTGMEIFLNYGDSWDTENSNSEEDEENLAKEDYDKIDATIDKMLEFFAKYQDELEPQAKADIYDFLIKDVMGAAAGAKKGRTITSMLPMNADDLVKVKQAGGSLRYSEPNTLRTLEWLQTYGRCMDNIRPGASTIPTAGRGAFATRAIPQGGLVAPVPLLQIVHDAVFDMYADYSDTEPYGRQLLYNYCLGHPASTLLFWPAGMAASFINHHHTKVNAKMAWSNHTFHRRHWFQQTPEELYAEENLYLGLLMEIVATKDIAAGEEVFLDYGNDWQAAYDAHVQEWNNKRKDIPAKWPLRALDLNDMYRRQPFPTEAELVKEPFPEQVELRCFLVVRTPAAEEGMEPTWQGKPVRVWVDSKDSTTMDGENLSPCTIVERIDLSLTDDGKKKKTKKNHKNKGGSAGATTATLANGLYNYTVRWGDKDTADDAIIMVKQVPHDAIIFIDKPGTSDQHTIKPFRHYISIPDDVFPQGPWRNNKVELVGGGTASASATK